MVLHLHTTGKPLVFNNEKGDACSPKRYKRVGYLLRSLVPNFHISSFMFLLWPIFSLSIHMKSSQLFFQLKAFYVDLLVPLETNLEKDTKVVQVGVTQIGLQILKWCDLAVFAFFSLSRRDSCNSTNSVRKLIVKRPPWWKSNAKSLEGRPRQD